MVRARIVDVVTSSAVSSVVAARVVPYGVVGESAGFACAILATSASSAEAKLNPLTVIVLLVLFARILYYL